MSTLYRGRGEILNTPFKTRIIFCHWLSEIDKKKKEEFQWMLYQITEIRLKEVDEVRLHFVMSKMTANGAKTTHKLHYY